MELYYIFMVEGGTGRILVQIPMGPGRSTNCKEKWWRNKNKDLFYRVFIYRVFCDRPDIHREYMYSRFSLAPEWWSCPGEGLMDDLFSST